MKIISKVLPLALATALVMTSMAGCKGNKPVNGSSGVSGSDATSGISGISGTSSLTSSQKAALSSSLAAAASKSKSGTTGNGSSGKANPSIVIGKSGISAQSEYKIPGVKDPIKTYPQTGLQTDLKGRTIKMQLGTVQTSTDTTSADGRLINNLRVSIEKKLNCKLLPVSANFDQMNASILAGDPNADIWVLGDLPTYMSAYKAKLLQPIDSLECLDFNDSSKYAALTNLTYVNNTHYGFAPQTFGIWRIAIFNIMFFNKKLLLSKGIQPSTIYNAQKNGTWNWAMFETLAKRVTDPAHGKYAITDANSNFYKDLMASNDTDWITRNSSGVFSFDAANKKAQNVITFYQKLVADKALSTSYDSSVDTINTTNASGQMSKDPDYKTFMSGKSYFYDAPAYVPFFKMFQTNTNNIGAVFAPMGPDAKKYYSYTDHACIIGIPVYADEAHKTAKVKAQETATVINYLYTPYKAQAQYDKQFDQDLSGFVTDSDYKNTFKNIYKNMHFSYAGMAAKIARTENNDGWYDYIPRIATGTDYSGVVNANKSRYNAYLANLLKQS